jgi:hypothetical protein
MYGSKTIQFGADTQPRGTSSYYGRYFRFDGTTPDGKNILQILLTAISLDRKVDVWFEISVDAGKNETTGATEANMSKVVHIGISG